MTMKKIIPLSLAFLLVVLLVALAAVWIFQKFDDDHALQDPGQQAVNSVEEIEGMKVSSAEVKELTVYIDGIITNLKENNKAVKASFAFELNGKKGKVEFENYDARIRSVINRTLADLSSADLAGSVGQDNLSTLLMNKMNSFLSDGKIRQINITELIIQ